MKERKERVLRTRTTTPTNTTEQAKQTNKQNEAATAVAAVPKYLYTDESAAVQHIRGAVAASTREQENTKKAMFQCPICRWPPRLKIVVSNLLFFFCSRFFPLFKASNHRSSP
eukprot:TRINITY_DN22532_c0_g1_i1.p1 TRINITY_DN22532_c0_g1~~TRINITY_DN22532_c0_g1_i1.p1  ORF type:complete len:113 (-),score=13.87 TRINITY_DN22532_c0_g1_i1:18-356(-)